LTRTIHVIGAGLAGLSAAVELAGRGERVTIYESGPAAGGRCRSYFDRGLGCRLDNGNHLLLSGNRAAMAFLERIGARNTLGGPGEPHFPFLDVASGAAWTLAPNAGRIPWWIFSAARRVPGTQPWDYVRLLALARAAPDATVADVLGQVGPLYTRLLEPLAIAALNTRPEEGLARLLHVVVQETLGRGGDFCVPSFPRDGLSESFIDPALAWLAARGARIAFNRRITTLGVQDGHVSALHLLDETVPLGADDAVVMAVPATVAGDLLPGVSRPDEFEAIVNVHFRTDLPAPPSWASAGFVGLIGGTAEWVFAKPGVVSVTISAANHLVDLPADDLAGRAWADVRRALGTQAAMPPVRVVKEKRATFAATAAQEARRPVARTALRNLTLAGDWTATGLPATIEGAIRSGLTAAESLRIA
jgi:squalene-associated FAD-dependent desaturase